MPKAAILLSLVLLLPTIIRAQCPSSAPLQLTPLLESGDLRSARALSFVDEPKFLGVENYAGYFTVNKSTNANLFFWYFPAQWDSWNAPVVLWLQGGPGASSLYGLFAELGPFELISRTEVKLRKYSWHKRFNLLFIDNPVGTGFSYTTRDGYLKDQLQIGRQLQNATAQFLQTFPELQVVPFFVAGESYAGKYVPSLGHAIYTSNLESEFKINLQGLIIGNGLTDPVNQINYSDYLYQLGLIDEIDKTIMSKTERECIQFIKQSNWTVGLRFLNEIYGLIESASGINNFYNFMVPIEDLKAESYMTSFLNDCSIKNALHVGSNTSFEMISTRVNQMLGEDFVQSVATWVSELLGHYRTLIYHGQLDIIVPYKLADNYLHKLNFDAADAFNTAPRRKWFVNGELAGYYKTAGNLTEVLVRNAGHMVPTDQPQWAFELITKFINNQDLS